MTDQTTYLRTRSGHGRVLGLRRQLPSGISALCAALLLGTSIASANGDSAGTDGSSQLNSVTVETDRDRAVIRRRVDEFVSTVAARPTQESLVRWGTPICPLVGGLPRDQAEFVLTRLSQIARSVGAPLAPAGPTCTPNLYIVATDQPDALLAAWRKRDARLFGSGNGPSIRRFVKTSRPVKVWYNADLTTGEGMPMSNDMGELVQGSAGASSGGNTQALAGIATNLHAKATFLEWNEVRQLTSAIVVLDKRLLHNVNFEQLADYIAMVSFTEVHQDADVGAMGSILGLFSDSGSADKPSSLSRYDEAYLRAMYHTDQRDKLQMSVIETHVTKELLN